MASEGKNGRTRRANFRGERVDRNMRRGTELLRLQPPTAVRIAAFLGHTKCVPKRGFKSLNRNYTAILNLSKIQNIIDKQKNSIKDTIDLKILKEKKLINKKFLKLKILGTGEIKKNIVISAHFASKQALSKIEKAGGKITIIKK